VQAKSGVVLLRLRYCGIWDCLVLERLMWCHRRTTCGLKSLRLPGFSTNFGPNHWSPAWVKPTGYIRNVIVVICSSWAPPRGWCWKGYTMVCFSGDYRGWCSVGEKLGAGHSRHASNQGFLSTYQLNVSRVWCVHMCVQMCVHICVHVHMCVRERVLVRVYVRIPQQHAATPKPV